MRRYILEAQFEDGFVYTGNQEDVSIVNPLRNVFFDIKEGLHSLHGALTRYTIYGLLKNGEGKYDRYDIDFTKLPKGSKPIWYIKREIDFTMGSDGLPGAPTSEARDMAYGFGYEFLNSEGKTEKEIIELL